MVELRRINVSYGFKYSKLSVVDVIVIQGNNQLKGLRDEMAALLASIASSASTFAGEIADTAKWNWTAESAIASIERRKNHCRY